MHWKSLLIVSINVGKLLGPGVRPSPAFTITLSHVDRGDVRVILKSESKLICLLPSAPCVYKESDPRNGHWIADTLSLPCHYLSLPSGAFGVPWGGWPEKEWIVSYPDPPSRQLFIEGVPQENYRNRFKMITETPHTHPIYPVPASPPSFFIC